MQKHERDQNLRYQGIYKDKHNRYIYFDKKNQAGIVIPQEDLRRWQLYKSRFLIPLLAAYLAHQIFTLSIPVVLVIGIALMAFMEYSYRKTIAQYVIINDYQPENQYNFRQELQQKDSWKVAFRAILFLILAILLLVSIFIDQRDLMTIENGIIVVCALFCFYNALVSFRVIINAKKEK